MLIKLTNTIANNYICAITDTLIEMIDKVNIYPYTSAYILIPKILNDPIYIVCSSVVIGIITINALDIITNIEIYDYPDILYKKDPNVFLKKFIGSEMDLKDVRSNNE